jgi:hypothetical protein
MNLVECHTASLNGDRCMSTTNQRVCYSIWIQDWVAYMLLIEVTDVNSSSSHLIPQEAL